MENIIKQVVQFLSQGIEAILKFLQLIWTWSFGQIVEILQSNWQQLPVWKIVILIAVLLGVAYCLYVSARQIWGAVESLFRAFVALLSAFVTVLPYIVLSGLIAFAGAYVIQSINF
ncbi:MAG: hypothetical protein DHS20C08_00260 [Rhodomicrobium sp.]|jgi:hypothetical protein|nr:MAG: hypothetical protein DHS20C08_00260 [Rhodomicrobium sp.]